MTETVRVNLDTTQYVRITPVDPFKPLSLIMQSHRDTVRIVSSPVQPSRSNTVYHELSGGDGPLNFPLVETAVWALAMTDQSALTVTTQRVPATVVDGDITTNTRALTRLESRILSGELWAGSTSREDVPIGDTRYQVIRTGSRWTSIEEIDMVFDFSNLGDGRYIFEVVIYIEGSNGNTFSYDQDSGTVVPMGRNIRTDLINVFTETVLEQDPTGVVVTGTPDFNVIHIEHFLNTQGNRETFTENDSTFFNEGRHVMLPPNTDVMIVSTTTGDAPGTASNSSTFFTSEFDFNV